MSARPATILIADDDAAIRTVLSHALSRQGHHVETTGAGTKLWQWVEAGRGDLVITDVMMPDENGLDLLPRIKKLRPDLKVIVMSARNTLLTAVKAAEKGAFEYLPKPFDLDVLINTVDKALEDSAKPSEGRRADSELDDGDEAMPLIGRSPAMQDIYRVMARLMGSDLTVMITGESGTGKELIARALHDYGQRRDQPFVAVNMAAIPRDLVESELFGHERGAFTGATSRVTGRFEQARGGTLFLDEIGDMPPDAQTRLLRVLQEGEYTTVGGRKAIKADVRIIAATHRDLSEAIRQGAFREDLFYRLNVVPIRVPPLRERIEDVALLVRHFLAEAGNGRTSKTIDHAAMERLKRHLWPGNVRELENLVRRLVVLHSADHITLETVERELANGTGNGLVDLGEQESEGLSEAVERHLRAYFAAHGDALPSSGLHGRVLREVERPLLSLTLEATRGNQIKAADLLGVNRNTLRKKIRELGIEITRGGVR